MFEPFLYLYDGNFKIILVDFLGYGSSARLVEFPSDLWQKEVRQTIALLEHLNYGKVSLVGSNGGVLIAINVVLLRLDLVKR